MSHRELKPGLSGQRATLERIQDSQDGLRNKRQARLIQKRLGSVPVSETIQTNVDFATAVTQLNIDAIFQRDDRNTCLTNLKVLNKITRYQRNYSIEQLFTEEYGVNQQIAARYVSNYQKLIQWVVALLGTDLSPDMQMICCSILCNITCNTLNNGSYIIASQTPFFDIAIALVTQRTLHNDIAIWDDFIGTLGNIAMEHHTFRDAVIASGLVEQIILNRPDVIEQEPLRANAIWLCLTLVSTRPLPPVSYLEKLWPFVTAVLKMLTFPISVEDPNVLASAQIVPFFAELSIIPDTDVYRNVISQDESNIGILVKCATYETTPAPIRESAVRCLSGLCSVQIASEQLLPALFHCMTMQSNYIRRWSATGILRLINGNPTKYIALISESFQMRTRLLDCITNANVETRAYMLMALAAIINLGNPDYYHAWLHDDIVKAFLLAFQQQGDDQAQIETCSALSRILAHPTIGQAARHAVEQAEGVEQFEFIYGTSTSPVVSDMVNTILERFFNANMDID